MGSVSLDRRGVSVAEALVSLLLLLLLAQLAWVATARASAAAEALEARGAALATERAAWWVLRDELAGGLASRDRSRADADSVSLRAFRGVARVCPGDGGDGRVRVRYGGVRRPEPGKDSVLALSGDGHWRPVDLVGVEGPATCPAAGGGAWEGWRLGSPVPEAALLRVFERGSYHVSGGALRYRMGAAGRQPLTPEVLADDGSGLEEGPGGLRVRIKTAGRPDSGWVRTLRPWEGGGR